MAQLRLGYSEIQQRGAEILQVTHSTPEEARLYVRRYQLAFPYLCDPDRVAHRLYGIPMVHHNLVGALRAMATNSVAAASDLVMRGERTALPTPHLKRYGLDDPEQAVFIIDRDGIIRRVFTAGPVGAIPSNVELVRELATLR